MVDIAIVGAGIQGANHARVSRYMPGVQVALVIDPDADRAQALASVTGAPWRTDLPDDYGSVSAAVLAVPTLMHAAVGVQLLHAGLDVLVEKPLAGTIADARLLVGEASRLEAVLMVGHVEQFNPAVLELDRLVHDVIHVTATRVGPYSGRVQEGVVLDLMIHDIELVRRLIGSPVKAVSSIIRRTRSPTEDLACALLTFESGATASLTASRIGQNKVRSLEITQASNVISVDLLRQDVTVSRVDRSEYLASSGASYRQTGLTEIPFIERRGEPLALQMEEFVDCVGSRRVSRVSGRDALAALEIALEVLRVSGP